MTDFEEEEQPRASFIRSYFYGPYRGLEYGGKGVMRYRRGFYDATQRLAMLESGPLRPGQASQAALLPGAVRASERP